MAMIVPEFWAEARISEQFGRDHVSGRRSLTVRRFGWSNANLADAQAMADARVREAFDRILAGASLPKRDPRVPYDAEGLPIREQIVERDGDVVITRNSYGARCLNSPDVLFADVDFDEPVSAWNKYYFLSSLAAALIAGAVARHLGVFLLSWIFATGIAIALAQARGRARHRADGGAEGRARRRIDAFVSAHPDWHLRLYRTPNGFRLLAMHRVFDPNDPAVIDFFEAIGADAYYALLCRRQHCFRARVSPKPWRIGDRARSRSRAGVASNRPDSMPKAGVWPIAAERMPERERWVEDYERKSQGYASCRFVEALGSRDYVMAAQAVQRLHDDLCRATSTLPLA
ncbi:hypothetical protein [Lysobacter capsici]|uniref:hypothetical protein n=1 Tax=Lysobacter capsici TaxID=435897 RepID=UPI001E5EA4F7|nr:hypothetical protein [Lysobacter capsici]